MFYVIHYTKLVHRKQFLVEQLNKRNLNYIFIENFDREILSTDDYIKFTDNLIKKAKGGKCANFLAHIEAMKMITKSEYKFNIILEDDAIFSDNFNEFLEERLKELPSNYNMFFLGEGCNMHISKCKLRENIYIYKTNTTRCTDSFVIDKQVCENIVNFYNLSSNKSINLPIDHWLNYVILKLKLNVYWLEPTIVKQGSITGGKFKSVL
tara:strand:- start:77 stop:703 length:627 start_codon:yes stop_codon:yes gene_type:complete